MQFIVRIILVAGLLLQSLPGLVMQRCVAMSAGEGGALPAAGLPQTAGCNCCRVSDDGSAVECPLAKQGYAGCNCKNPQDRETTNLPPTSPKDHKNPNVEQWLPAPLATYEAPLPEALGWLARPAWVDVFSHRSPSIQSLQCVWRL